MLSDDRADEIKNLARKYAELAIETLAEVAADGDAKENARVAAAKTLLERGFGAPERKVEQNVNHTIVDQRQAHLDALRRLAERKEITVRDNIEDAEFTVIPKANREDK